MPTNKLPLLGGGERELRDGDRVRLRCGIDLTIETNGTPLHCDDTWWAGLCIRADGRPLWWDHSGKCRAGQAYDIVLILGPAEETHGDGTTVGLLKTVRVHGNREDAERVTEVSLCYRGGANGDLMRDATICLLSPKPTPSPTYTERLIEAVRKGEVVLPLKATRLRFIDNQNGGLCMCENPGERGSWIWPQYALGPLPPWQPGMEESIDLATVREAAEVGK